MNSLSMLKQGICVVLGLTLVLQTVGCTTFQPVKSYNETEIQQYEPEEGARVKLKLKEHSKFHTAGKLITCRVLGFTQEGITIEYLGVSAFQKKGPHEIAYADILEIEILKQKLNAKGIAIAVGVAFAIILMIGANWDPDFFPGGSRSGFPDA